MCCSAGPIRLQRNISQLTTMSHAQYAGTGLGNPYMNQRLQTITQHFPTALGQEDFLCRCETALAMFGFTGENSIAMTNLCRDEVRVAPNRSTRRQSFTL